MIIRKKADRLLLFMLAGILCFAAAALGSGPEEEALSEGTENVYGSPEEESELQPGAADRLSLPELVTEETVREYMKTLGNIDPQVVREDLAILQKLTASEDFKDLFSRAEIQEFAEATLKKLYNMALDEPELVEKICLALEVDRKSVNIMLILLTYLNENREKISEFAGSDTGKETLAMAMNLAADPDLLQSVLDAGEEMGLLPAAPGTSEESEIPETETASQTSEIPGTSVTEEP